MGKNTKEDTIADTSLDYYGPEQIADLTDEQLIELRDVVNSELTMRAKRCEGFIKAIGIKKSRAPRAKKTAPVPEGEGA